MNQFARPIKQLEDGHHQVLPSKQQLCESFVCKYSRSGLSWLTPVAVHHAVKKWLWKTEERETFEVAYQMNTRKTLRNLFSRCGILEAGFAYPADCRILTRWKTWNMLEFWAWKLSKCLNIPYPETCLLGIYQNRFV